MTPAVALLDANVLYPAPLRDLPVQLAFDGLFQARWSADIDDEWTRNLRAARPELTAQIERTKAVMRRAIPDALVTGYAARVAGLSLPDPGDRHVLAAAITAPADVIVTFNIKDFPAAALAPHGLKAHHPDEFLQSYIATMQSQLLTGVRECLARLTNRPISASSYLSIMRSLGLTETAMFLHDNLAHWRP